MRWSFGQRRRDEDAGASRRRRRMRARRRRRNAGGGRPAPGDGWRAELLNLHNQARPANFRLNGDLCESAQGRAEKMDHENRMYHESDWWRRIERSGYRGGTSGENLAAGFDDPERAMRAWLNSPPHRKNIMNGNFDDIGFGRSGEYLCVHFGGR